MLFTVNKSPYLHGNLEGCLRLAAAGTRLEGLLRQALASHPVYAVEADLKARGIARLIEGVRVIDYAGFVELVEQHPVVPWL